jgi:hypothetical protein
MSREYRKEPNARKKQGNGNGWFLVKNSHDLENSKFVV